MVRKATWTVFWPHFPSISSLFTLLQAYQPLVASQGVQGCTYLRIFVFLGFIVRMPLLQLSAWKIHSLPWCLCSCLTYFITLPANLILIYWPCFIYYFLLSYIVHHLYIYYLSSFSLSYQLHHNKGICQFCFLMYLKLLKQCLS